MRRHSEFKHRLLCLARRSLCCKSSQSRPSTSTTILYCIQPLWTLRRRLRLPCCVSMAIVFCLADIDNRQYRYSHSDTLLCSCKGSMRCFMRGVQNPDQRVPNCAGEGVPQADYCFLPDEAQSLQAPVQLETRAVDCGRIDKPCMQCQGGKFHELNLVCFVRLS